MDIVTQQTYTIAKAMKYIEENRHAVNPSYRHNYHVMPPIGWMNDPNGFVYYQGEYHLFYQFHPYDSKWGPMHWGHAKTKDLIHWEELPVALAPDQPFDKDGCFSGSAIEKDGKLYLMYTGHSVVEGKSYQTQCVAVSEDGIQFKKYSQNPVIGEQEIGANGDISEFRDPKVFEREGSYYMVVATKTQDNRGRILLYKSHDLLEWSFYSILLEGTAEQGVMWECPDLFHLDGKDALIMSPIQMTPSGTEYHNTSSTVAFIGEMDWERGTLEVENYHEIDRGLDFYAPQTTLDDQNRRIMIAWMQMWGRTLPTDELGHRWTGAMTLPRELGIKDNCLIQKPVSDIYNSLEDSIKLENVTLQDDTFTLRNAASDNSYLRMELDAKHADEVLIRFAQNTTSSLVIRYDTSKQELTLSREEFGHNIVGSESQQLTSRQMSVPLTDKKLVLEIFRDTSSIELFANEERAMTFTFYEEEKGSDLSIRSKGTVKIEALDLGSVQV